MYNLDGGHKKSRKARLLYLKIYPILSLSLGGLNDIHRFLKPIQEVFA